MSEDATVTVRQLSDAAKHHAVGLFAKFYIQSFRCNKLEILTDYPIVPEMEQINHYITQNNSFHPEQLLSQIQQSYGSYFYDILIQLKQNFRDDGTPSAGSWTKWYSEKFQGLRVEE